VYDLSDASFLFMLNNEWVLDAHTSGRKLKFANHSAKQANCYPRVVQVNGDHRVGIFAKCDIPAMSELFYKYGESFVAGWKKAAPKPVTE